MAKLDKSEIVENEELDTELEVADEDNVIENGDDENEELEESAADTLKPNSMPVGPANKSAAIGKVVNAMAGMDKETINKFVASIELIGKEARNIPDSDAAKNKGTLNTKPSAAGVQLVTKLEDTEYSVSDLIKEDVSEIFAGEELTEEFKDKIAVILESAINLKVDQKIVALEEEYENRYNEEIDEITESLIQTFDDYATYAATEWMKMNEVAITSTLKSDLTEDFVENLKALFETHYITIPEDRVDVLEEMNARIEELELSESNRIEEIQSLKNDLSNKEAVLAITEMSKGLTESEVEKLFELAESVEYTTVDDLVSKVTILKENYFGEENNRTTNGQSEVLFEETEKLDEEVETPKLRGPMASYVNTLSRISRN